MKISDLAKTQIAILYDDGYTISELAEKYHISKNTIRKILKEMRE